MCERAASDFHQEKKSNFRVLEVAVLGRARHHRGVVVRPLSFRSRLQARPKSSRFIFLFVVLVHARLLQYPSQWAGVGMQIPARACILLLEMTGAWRLNGS